MTEITVAALQLAFSGDIDANIRRVSELVREAHGRGAQVILPPELFEGEYFCRVEDEGLFANAAPVGEHKAVLAMQGLAEALKVTIPTKVSWKPGQHFFVRFLNLGIHAATSHPFTVATLCSADEKDGHVIELYSRTHGGITGRLAAVAESGQRSLRFWVH